MFLENFILRIVGEQQPPIPIINSGISMTSINAEKDPGCFKLNSIYLWPNDGYFKKQTCYFLVEKADMDELTVFYINQACLGHNFNKKIYYFDVFILDQVTPIPNPPEDLKNYIPKENEAKIVFPKYNVISGQFLELVETLGYFPVRGDEHECFFNYGYIKKDSFRVIPNRFSTAVFNRHRIQYEAEALLDTDFTKLFFFLLSTTYRCMNSVNIKPIDIDSREFGKDFDQSTLDFENSGRTKKKKKKKK